MVGFSELIGSWNTIAIEVPSTARSVAGEAVCSSVALEVQPARR